MRFDPAKAWPHPVLRPRSYGDDYPHGEFEVEIEVNRAQGSMAVEVEAEFQLSDLDLLRLVGEGSCKYVLLIKASKTHFRDLIDSDVAHIQKIFPAGDLSGRVEFAPFLVCTRKTQTAFARKDGIQTSVGERSTLPPARFSPRMNPRTTGSIQPTSRRSDLYSHTNHSPIYPTDVGHTNLLKTGFGS